MRTGLLLLVISLTGRPALDAAQDAEWSERFRTEVAPFLEQTCLKCHSGEKPEGGLNLTSREHLLRGGDSGQVIDPDAPDESLLLSAIRYEGPEMPPNGRVSDQQIRLLADWIRGGTVWPADREKLQAPAAHSAPQVNAEARRHWSFQPVKRPQVPATDQGWEINEIDHFIAAGLQKRGLKAAPRAAPQTLVRRAGYGLLGLPPDQELQREFVSNPDSAAWRALIDALLASPHYGEHWGRHWLDLVRYAETNSYERDGAKPYVWRYRDYVISAFNDDVPYDQFLMEQLAGDELSQVTANSIVATGYYRLGRWDDEPADPELAVFDDLDDILTVTSQTMLGLTVNCARCHDHKIDPVPQQDYYRMLAFFRGIRRYGVRSEDSVRQASLMEIDRPEDEQVYAAALVRYETELMRLDEELDKLAQRVTPLFSDVEQEEFRHEMNRIPLIRKHANGVLNQRELQKYERLTGQRRTHLDSRPSALAQALSVREDVAGMQPTWVLLRGNPHVRGDEVQPGFPEVLSPPEPELLKSLNPETSGRRLALAKWITDPANPLTARVMVNRIWQYHFGRGLVRTASDFGFQGERPTHPELLDWLASEFVQRNWSIAEMHRLIMHSAVYQFSSAGDPQALESDPLNESCWRFDMRRLSAEELRDSILAVSGVLNLDQVFGPSIYSAIPDEVKAGQSRPGSGWGVSPPEQEFRRSIYIHVKRSLPDPLLERFDMADTDQTCPVRFNTTQPTQALALMNSEFVQQQAGLFAERLQQMHPHGTPRQLVGSGLQLVMQRAPTSDETAAGVALLTGLQEEEQLSPEDALRFFCLTALNLSEFIFVD